MKPVDMLNIRKPGEPDRGDCFRACVASLLELDPATLPNFADAWPQSWIEWAGGRYDLVEHEKPPMGDCIAVGLSPRDPKITHGVVWNGYALVHDPHPSRAGLVGRPMYYWQILENKPHDP